MITLVVILSVLITIWSLGFAGCSELIQSKIPEWVGVAFVWSVVVILIGMWFIVYRYAKGLI
jgi:hypothetical protein